MTSPEAIDVLILIALTQEAETFHDLPFYTLKEEPRLGVFPYHSFEYEDANGTSRRGALVSVGEIGLRIRDAALRFSEKFSPKLVLNVGIPLGSVMSSSPLTSMSLITEQLRRMTKRTGMKYFPAANRLP
ncbi:hypothetical protein H8B02_41975 [Bradyrhizobium sp. Pear77]|uniref:hypothetical protein n=1 Tax=Bradyrhizobium altum TaxID=1571202 RepID=UPI001E371D6F|nr:hypothetical protein [Bradyrhizobium altum]MCC8959744.1 hypothetical protein [Bradyrhizobium altum]